eukprot:m.71923 g.71923  ORF g.71923 m.71923 type:complete len:553 (+) comp14221_c1_seq1:117-1775(+)
MPKKLVANIRKSVHKKDGKSSPPKGAPPSAFANRLNVDRVPTGGVAIPRRDSSRFRRTKKVELTKLPSLKEKPPKERPQLFLQKVQQCCAVFDFTEALSELKSKEVKRAALNELIEYLSTNRKVVVDEYYPAIVEMFAVNLFRAMPPPADPVAPDFDPEEDEPTLEAAWPHLTLVYELFLRLLESPDFNAQFAKKYIDQAFVIQLLELFDSEDPRERDFVKTVLHRVYGKFLSLRGFLRKSINNVFHQFVYETQRHNGIAELLEILGSIINGFALPLKPEHKSFLLRVLLPLHKLKSVNVYHAQLAYCVVQFLEKDVTLVKDVVKGILKFWPKVNCPKVVLLLNELEEILEIIEPDGFAAIQEPLFQELARCVVSPHFQVAERALYFFNNEYLLTLMADSADKVFPIVFPPLYKYSTAHWNRSIHQLIFNALKVLRDINSAVFDDCSAKYKANLHNEQRKAQQREERWKELEKRAKSNPLSQKVPIVTPEPVLRPIDYSQRQNTSAKPAETVSSGGGLLRRKSMLPHDPSTQRALEEFSSTAQEHVLVPVNK